MQNQVRDLRAEGKELVGLLERLTDADWDRATLFKSWTVDDILQHLYSGDERAAASIDDAEKYDALSAALQAARDAGLSRVEEARRRLGDLHGRRLLDRFRDQGARLCDLLAALQPGDRLRWGGRSMSARVFASARQMEYWAHAQAIYDLLGLERPRSDRLRNIAELGVRTFGFTFANRGLPVPEPVPYVRLRAPSGAVWEWNAPSADSRVEGEGFDFCQVVAQTRNIADTQLAVTGDVARSWMAMAQCFAGAPETPPPPGYRRRS
jgi:uncharacterized protein (TIGR03084 family)